MWLLTLLSIAAVFGGPPSCFNVESEFQVSKLLNGTVIQHTFIKPEILAVVHSSSLSLYVLETYNKLRFVKSIGKSINRIVTCM